jgi:hypothetical protein
MSFVKTIALATVLMFGASQLVFAQAGNPHAGGVVFGTESGHPEKAQNSNRGPSENPGGWSRLPIRAIAYPGQA